MDRINEILTNHGEAWEYMNTLQVCPLEDAQKAMEQYAKEKVIEELQSILVFGVYPESLHKSILEKVLQLQKELNGQKG